MTAMKNNRMLTFRVSMTEKQAIAVLSALSIRAEELGIMNMVPEHALLERARDRLAKAIFAAVKRRDREG
jgi:hypothetical protein